MELWNSVIERFSDILSNKFLDIEIWRIAVAGIIIILTIAVRKILVNTAALLIKKFSVRTKWVIDDELIVAVEPPVKLMVLIISIYFSARILGFKVTDESFSGHIIRSLIIFSLFWAIYRTAEIIARMFYRVSKKTHTHLDDILIPVINKGIKAVVVVISINVIAKEWKYDLGALLAGLGLGGLAFALAAQETLSNLFGGLAIMLDKPFNVGEYIQFDGMEGTVEDIGFRSTRIRTPDKTIVTIPNSTIAKANIINCSRRDRRRVKFSFPIKYGTTAKQLEQLLRRIREMLENHPDIHNESIYVYLDAFGTNGLELLLIFYTRTAEYRDYLAVKEDINLKLMNILNELGIEIAIPAVNVYVENK
ncbi:hypothetical protein Cst_c13460 [Thermoclostridium stercorarium subsp. stercorarium DSM 8532]|jgi:MscS family membrane protein|uniref:Mechanosensitive ion channel protein MscS n=2 Tax=Thermoclostridium stercorarium TaxID=1510 RepID=L7VNI9_THES1|nr:mechanosensitive ion channel family protein [Thermoclostridium stercorarium]AGC68337.1 hypothetical protein Cst_c13460 [Thermoclostridium stercorarium subsp. stercorarium DSM 8532]AGI39361.1 small-conductance channel protein [Thermoclostridium stercorarium subsp. stercorarium DSM 8532]ANW98680.1 hypothetical protein CSTERTH_06380 [Thermoclostridium stercorarium subsp. thermolacticum DSM 2910]